MSKGYVFIANSTKPSRKERADRGEVRISNFSRPWLEAALDLGYDVHLGVNRARPDELGASLAVRFYDSRTYRSVFDIPANVAAVVSLCRMVRRNKVRVIHCNTPLGGFVGRVGGWLCRVPTVIYSVHGFHYFAGAPVLNRTVFRWVEEMLARVTDVMIVMNSEDLETARGMRLRGGGAVYSVPGVGVDVGEFGALSSEARAQVRASLGLEPEDIAIISVGDLVPRKNVAAAIDVLGRLNDTLVQLIVCGRGPELDSLAKRAARLGVGDRVHFLGFRSDVKRLLAAADIFLSTSLQEGLPRSTMEAMASGLPCVTWSIRGNVDLVREGEGGYMREVGDLAGLTGAVRALAEDSNLRSRMGKFNRAAIVGYDVDSVRTAVREIYREVLG